MGIKKIAWLSIMYSVGVPLVILNGSFVFVSVTSNNWFALLISSVGLFSGIISIVFCHRLLGVAIKAHRALNLTPTVAATDSASASEAAKDGERCFSCH